MYCRTVQGILKFQARDVDDLSTLRQLSSERGVPVPRLKRELPTGLKLVRRRFSAAREGRSSSGAAGVGGRARVTQGRTFLWGCVLARRWDYYLASWYVWFKWERGRVLFLDYDEYATVATSELLEADETTVAGSAPYEAHGDSIVASYDDDFRRDGEWVGWRGWIFNIFTSTFVQERSPSAAQTDQRPSIVQAKRG